MAHASSGWSSWVARNKASPLKTSYKYGAYRTPVSRVFKKTGKPIYKATNRGDLNTESPILCHAPEKTMVGRWVSFGDYLFSGAVLNIWGVDCMYSVIFTRMCVDMIYMYIYIYKYVYRHTGHTYIYVWCFLWHENVFCNVQPKPWGIIQFDGCIFFTWVVQPPPSC